MSIDIETLRISFPTLARRVKRQTRKAVQLAQKVAGKREIVPI
jgi:hypothetical protein